MSSRTISDDAERAVRRIGALTGFYRQAARTFRGGPIRVRLGVVRSPEHLRTLREAVIVRCVSIIEAYATDLGQATLEAALAESGASATDPARTEQLIDHLKAERWERVTRK